MILSTCVTCGRVYYAKSRNPNNKYCSDACSQKAYRERKKEQRASKESTLTMEAWLIYQDVCNSTPQAKGILDHMYSIYGARVFSDIMVAWNEIAKIGVES